MSINYCEWVKLTYLNLVSFFLKKNHITFLSFFLNKLIN